LFFLYIKAAAAERGDLNELLDLAVKENADVLEQNRQLREQNESLRASDYGFPVLPLGEALRFSILPTLQRRGCRVL